MRERKKVIMKRTLFVVLALMALATAASAATITIASDKLTYNVGDTIHITVTGDSQGGKSNGIFGRLEYSAALTDTVTSSQNTLAGGGGTFTTGHLSRGDGFDEVMNAINGTTLNITVSNLLQSTATLVAQATGVVDLVWSNGAGFELNFFGLTTANQPGSRASFTIGAIPEPATAALIGLGLIGLALGGRRRS